MTRDELTDRLALAIHGNCGTDECGAGDMHVDDAINVMGELIELRLIAFPLMKAEPSGEDEVFVQGVPLATP